MIRAADLPGWERALSEARARFAHCDYAWAAAGECTLPVTRKPASVELVRDLARALTDHEAYRPQGLRLVEGGAS